jgi:hypothetical protein
VKMLPNGLHILLIGNSDGLKFSRKVTILH